MFDFIFIDVSERQEKIGNTSGGLMAHSQNERILGVNQRLGARRAIPLHCGTCKFTLAMYSLS